MRVATNSELARADADRAELTAIVTRRHARLVATAVRILHDEREAEDAVQDACLQAVRHLDRFDHRSRLSSWLHRVVVNAALMRLRARRRRPTEMLDEATAADHAASVEALVHRRELQALVRRSLADAPAHHRAVLVLRDIEGGDPADVARMLRVTRGALKVRAHRARKALRVRLSALGIERPVTQPRRTKRAVRLREVS